MSIGVPKRSVSPSSLMTASICRDEASQAFRVSWAVCIATDQLGFGLARRDPVLDAHRVAELAELLLQRRHARRPDVLAALLPRLVRAVEDDDGQDAHLEELEQAVEERAQLGGRQRSCRSSERDHRW